MARSRMALPGTACARIKNLATRLVCRFGVAILLFGALAYPAMYLHLLVMRKVFRLLETIGVLTRGSSYWGQILGLNIPQHSDLLHAIVDACSAGVAFAPVMLLSILTSRRRAFGRRVTRCGSCRVPLRNLTEARCPTCETPI